MTSQDHNHASKQPSSKLEVTLIIEKYGNGQS